MSCFAPLVKAAKWEAYINRQKARSSCSPEEFPCCREDGTPPVARSNRVDGRGRGGTNCGEKNQNNGTQKQQWPNFPRTGKNILKLAKLTDTLFPGIPLVLLLIITQANGNPHEPMAWKLYNLPESKLIQTQIGPGKWNFSVNLYSLIPIEQDSPVFTPDLAKLQAQCKAFYICPSSNPGRSYCN